MELIYVYSIGIEDKRIKQTLMLIKVLPAADRKNGQIYSIQQLIVPFDVFRILFYFIILKKKETKSK